jgi:hypothetical protein
MAGMFIYSSHGKWAFPPLLWSFLTTATFTCFPTLLLLAGQVLPLLPSLASLFIYSSVRGCPSPLWFSGHPALFATCLFCCLLFSWFFSLFSLSWGWSVQGAMLIWPRIVCGRTTCHLAHLVVYIFPSGLGAVIWWHRSPPGFSI